MGASMRDNKSSFLFSLRPESGIIPHRQNPKKQYYVHLLKVKGKIDDSDTLDAVKWIGPVKIYYSAYKVWSE
jgi:hypothetical protein